MESTFKKAYEKEILPDDSIKLTFREGPIEAHQISLFTALVMGYLFILLWAWLPSRIPTFEKIDDRTVNFPLSL